MHSMSADLHRTPLCVDREDHSFAMISGKRHLNFTSNDYLNLATHPDVISTVILAVSEFGLGSGASPQVSGFTTAHDELEKSCAAFLKRDAALLFNSGYHANLAVMTTIANRETLIIADKYCHASLLDGMSLSRAKLIRYQHQDLDHAETLLKKYSHRKKIIVSESIFSMEGRITRADELAILASRYRTPLIMDDAHAVGVLGKNGGGVTEHYSLTQDQLPCLITPFGKALGSMGAVVSGSRELIDHLYQSARTHRYSTAIPAAICKGTSKAIALAQSQSHERAFLQLLSDHFNQTASQYHLTLASDDLTPIKSILIGNNDRVIQLQAALLEKGFFVSAIRPPTVPANTARIRISLNINHTQEQISQLLKAMKECYEKIR